MENIENAITCPICLEIMSIPIMQCDRGHSMCGDCITNPKITKCPHCRRSVIRPVRNHQLEDLIQGMKKIMKVNCFYSKLGCTYALSLTEKQSHELECRFRTFHCEGSIFAKWKCNWLGDYTEIYNHFTECHLNHMWMSQKTEVNIRMCLTKDFYDLQIINFCGGQNYFYYKHKIDTATSKVYWVLQYIGLKDEAHQYYYEFEIYRIPTRKFKVNQICENDTVDVNELFAKERCVVLSFDSIKNFLNSEGEVSIKFRIMPVRNY